MIGHLNHLVPDGIMSWTVFGSVVAALLFLDLAVFNRKAHEVRIREALAWSAFWVALAFLFNLGVYLELGHDKALRFLAAYLIEESLSIDNLFVFLLIFTFFSVEAKHQHRVLFWGILGAMVMRGLFIAAGVTLVTRFQWVSYLFGAFLVLTGLRLAFKKGDQINPGSNPVLKLLRKTGRVSAQTDGKKFLSRSSGRLMLTPLLVVLVVIETSDLMFAVDSIPAALAITVDPFIVYSSNIFAILGLRSLYFVLAGMMRKFHHLHYGLAVILASVGLKMLVSQFYEVPVTWTLGLIALVLAASVAASLIWPEE